MAKTIGIFAEPEHRRSGPQKVLENLWAGLVSLGIQPYLNKLGHYNVCLQHWSQYINLLPPETLLGPNVNPPWMLPDIYSRFKNYLCPSNWIKKAFTPYLPEGSLHVWPVGIDINKFYPTNSVKNKVLVYYKNRPIEELNLLRSKLDEWGVSYEILTYGEYTEEQLIKTADQCYAGILLTHTESQGIAYMELMAMGLALFCFNVKSFEYDKDRIVEADSAPYMIGIKSVNLSHEFPHWLSLKRFLEKDCQLFDSRKFIVENHSLEQSAFKLLQIFEKVKQ